MESTNIGINEASIILELSPQQVRNLCRKEYLHSQKISGNWILNKKNVLEYRNSTKRGIVPDKYRNGKVHHNIEVKKPISLSFFSGAMGLDLGLEQAGFQTNLACETDLASRQTITLNKPEVALIGNILEYSAEEIRTKAGLSNNHDIDLISGGPPCQAFSTAGKRKGIRDSRGNLVLSFVDTIIKLRPKYAIIENVRGILSAGLIPTEDTLISNRISSSIDKNLKGGVLLEVVERLKQSGYGINFNLYNSANFGTPQKRERVIIIASRDGEKLPYLTPTHSENGEFGLPKWNTFRSAVEDLSTKELHGVGFPEKRLKYYRLLKSGQNWRNLSDDLQKEAMGKSYYLGGGKTGFLRRLDWDKPAPTLVTHPAMPATDLAHPVENRPLSIEEYKRIQQFPDNWTICGKLLEQYKQIGNAVPVGLGKAIGTLIIRHMNGNKIKSYEGFRYSRYLKTTEHEWENNLLAKFENMYS